MFQLIAFIVLLVSVVIITLILAKKIPTLNTLPHDGHHGIKKHTLIAKIESKIKDAHFQVFTKQVWLHKLLSNTRIGLLKLESKINDMLHGMRKKTEKLENETKKKDTF